jgi:hypothetical protein
LNAYHGIGYSRDEVASQLVNDGSNIYTHLSKSNQLLSCLSESFEVQIDFEFNFETAKRRALEEKSSPSSTFTFTTFIYITFTSH